MTLRLKRAIRFFADCGRRNRLDVEGRRKHSSPFPVDLMKRNYETYWKKTYWPEPRLGREETRTEAIRRVRGKAKPSTSGEALLRRALACLQ